MRIMIRAVSRGERSVFWSLASPLLALLVTVAMAGALFAAIGQAPGAAIHAFLVEPLTSARGWTAVTLKAAPLAMIAIGLSVAYRCSVWNIGAEGQFTLGAIAAGGLILHLGEDASPLLYVIVPAAGVLGGMAWAGLTAWLRTQFNASEILTSLMLTYVAQFVLITLVTGPWRDPEGFGFPQTAEFADWAQAPRFFQGALHLGCLLTPFLGLAAWVLIARSVLGFQFRVLGDAPRAARFAGFKASRLIWTAMLVSGGFAGLAGAFEVTGQIGQLTTTLSPGYGFAAIIVALLARLNPLGTLLSGFLLALTFVGGDGAQIALGLPNAVTSIFQGILLFALIASDFLILNRLVRRRAAHS